MSLLCRQFSSFQCYQLQGFDWGDLVRDSIIVNMKYADYDLIDGRPNVERHHCLMGPDREKADEDGLWVTLTQEHHTAGKMSAHKCIEVQRLLQIIAQLAYERDRCAEGMGKEDA